MDQRLTEAAVTDWRALCAELADALDHNRQCLLDDRRLTHPLADRARAALAQPEPEAVVPTDEELLEINDGAYCPCADEVNGEDDSSWQYTSDYIRWLDENGTPQEQGAYAAKGLRAVFEAGRRWGHQPAPPAEGEVAELVEWLRDRAAGNERFGAPTASAQLTRAADLLEQRHSAPVPVASDTRYEFSVLDADYTERAGGSAPTYAQALSEGQHYLAQYQQDGPHTLEVRRVEALHPDALPVLPEGAQVIEPAKHTILVPVPEPVPVAERLPGAGDCDGEGFCWFWSPEDQCWFWERQDSTFCRNYGTEFHWLPAHALPLPQGEGG